MTLNYTFETEKAFEMGLNPNMKNLTLVKMELKKLVDRFDVIVITEKLFESLVLMAQRNRFDFQPSNPNADIHIFFGLNRKRYIESKKVYTFPLNISMA